MLSYLSTNLPTHFQFLDAILIAVCRELDKKMRTHLVTKMMGALDEPASSLLAITTGLHYSSFVAVRIAGATGATVFCVVTAIDFAIHSYITYKRIRQYNETQDEDSENDNKAKKIKTTNLILAELVEGFTPLIYDKNSVSSITTKGKVEC